MRKAVKTLAALLWRGFKGLWKVLYVFGSFVQERLTLRLFTIRGIPAYVHGSLVLMLGLIALILLFMGGLKATAFGMLIYGVMFSSVLLHELGHVAAAAFYGVRTNSIVLYPIGGVAYLKDAILRPYQELVIALAGPMVNVVLISLSYALLKLAVGIPIPAGTSSFWVGTVALIFLINLTMLLFNLLPAYPMDGGRILRGILGILGLSFKTSLYVAAGVSVVSCVFIGALGIYLNPMLIITAIPVGGAALLEVYLFKYVGDERYESVDSFMDSIWSIGFIMRDCAEVVGNHDKVPEEELISRLDSNIWSEEIREIYLDFFRKYWAAEAANGGRMSSAFVQEGVSDGALKGALLPEVTSQDVLLLGGRLRVEGYLGPFWRICCTER